MDFAEEMLGVELLPWQRWLYIHAMELRPDGRFRFRVLVILIARQNGKTTVMEVKNLWKMFILAVPLVISCAQDLDIAEESWDKAVELVEANPELNAEKKHVDKTNGKKALRLENGSRWKPKAATRKAGRSLSGDDVNLDELREHHTWEAWGALSKTMMARANAQLFAYSNAGDKRSVVLNSLVAKGRALAIDPTPDPSLGLFEWSAPDDVMCTCVKRSDSRPHDADCRLRDREAWAQANPSLGYTITEDAVESALSTDPETVFRTEVLCQEVEELEPGVISPQQWSAICDASSKRAGQLSIGVDIALMLDSAAITIYGERADGLGHGQVIDYRPGYSWLVSRLLELKVALDPVAIGMGKGTYERLKPELEKVGLRPPENADEPKRGELLVVSGVGMAAASSQLIAAVRDRSFRVVTTEALDLAVAGAQIRTAGDTIAWTRKDSAAEICPVCSLTVARFAHLSRVDVVDKHVEQEFFASWR